MYERQYYSEEVAYVLMMLAGIEKDDALFKAVEEAVWRVSVYSDNGRNPEATALYKLFDLIAERAERGEFNKLKEV